jgi:hypothetical protein
VQVASYVESEARISYVFRQRLPEGFYVVRLPAQAGLVDLAGLSPVAPGAPAGVLGGFAVGPGQASSDPTDLGAAPLDTALAGITREVAIDPGASVSYRIVVTVPSTYSFQGHHSGGELTLRLIGPDRIYPLDPGAPDALGGTNDLELEPGEYFLQLSASGDAPVDAGFTLKALESPLESIDWNGVGQGPGLSLRLIHPQLMDSPPSAMPLMPPAAPVSPPPVISPPTAISPSVISPPVISPPPVVAPQPVVSVLPVVPPTTVPPSAPTPASEVASAPLLHTGDQASPGPNSAPRPGRGPDAGLSIDRTAPRIPAAFFLGPGGDYVGRPAPFTGNSTFSPAGADARGSPTARDAVGLRQRTATGFGPPEDRAWDRSAPRSGVLGEGNLVRAPRPGEPNINYNVIVHVNVPERASLARSQVDRLREAVLRLLEYGSRDASVADSFAAGDPVAPGVSSQVPDRAEHAPQATNTPAYIALAAAAVFQFRRQIYRSLVRLRLLNPARHPVRVPALLRGLPVPQRTRNVSGATAARALGVERKQAGSTH